MEYEGTIKDRVDTLSAIQQKVEELKTDKDGVLTEELKKLLTATHSILRMKPVFAYLDNSKELMSDIEFHLDKIKDPDNIERQYDSFKILLGNLVRDLKEKSIEY